MGYFFKWDCIFLLLMVCSLCCERLFQELESTAGFWCPVEETGVHDSEKHFFQLLQATMLAFYLKMPGMNALIHFSVDLKLYYCDPLYMCLPLKTIQKLQLVWKAAACLLSGARQWYYVIPILKSLHWLLINFQVQLEVVALTFKSIHNLCSQAWRTCLLASSHEAASIFPEGLSVLQLSKNNNQGHIVAVRLQPNRAVLESFGYSLSPDRGWMSVSE